MSTMTTRHVEVDGTLLGSGAGSWLKCVQGKVRHSLEILSLVATAAASLLEDVTAMMSHVVSCKEDSKLPSTAISMKMGLIFLCESLLLFSFYYI